MAEEAQLLPQSAKSESLSTCFPRLPLEIRTMIWKQTPGPRVVEILFGDEAYYDDRDNESVRAEVCIHNEQGFHTNIRTPVALEICQEPRKAVIASYPLCFGSVWFPRRIRINFEIDTLFINDQNLKVLPLFFSLLDQNESHNLRYPLSNSVPFLKIGALSYTIQFRGQAYSINWRIDWTSRTTVDCDD